MMLNKIASGIIQRQKKFLTFIFVPDTHQSRCFNALYFVLNEHLRNQSHHMINRVLRELFRPPPLFVC